MSASWTHVFLVLIWVLAINSSAVAIHVESDMTKTHQDKEAEKEVEIKTIQFKDWKNLFGLNPKENYEEYSTSFLGEKRHLLNQWSPVILIRPPKAS